MALVSIGIPCYNAEAYIHETLESISEQTYPEIELVIVDDASCDATFKIIQDWGEGKKWVKILKNESNLGLVKTVNKIVSNCTGEYFQLVGHDDILLKHKISTQVNMFQKLPSDVGLIYSNVSVIDEQGKIMEADYLRSQGHDSGDMRFDDIIAQLLSCNFIPSISVLIKKTALEKVGRYDEGLAFEDLDMWLRICMLFQIAYLPEVTALYRRNENSLMHDPVKRINIYASLLSCREKYRGIKPEWDKIINQGIIQMAPTLYRYHHSSGKKWLTKRLQYDKHFKSWVYWLLSKFNSRILWGN